MKSPFLSVFVFCTSFLFLLSCVSCVKGTSPDQFATANPWHRFRGVAGDGISLETGLLKAWPNQGLEPSWRAPIGIAYSGMTVADGRVFTMDSQEGQEFTVCLDETSGAELWRTAMGPMFEDSNGNGPRSAPTVNGDRVYALGAHGDLKALHAETGEVVWHVNYKERFKAEAPDWGYATSPLVLDGTVYIEPGGENGNGIAALNAEDGSLIWARLSDPAGYSSPILIKFEGVDQIVFLTSLQVVSLTPEGEVLWQFPWQEKQPIKIAMPVFAAPDKIFVSASYDSGGLTLQMKKVGNGVEVSRLWENKFMRNHFNTSVVVGKYLYGFDNATLKCIDTETGEQQWGKRRLGKGSLILADGHFIILSERGTLHRVEVSPESYRETAQFRVFKGRCWTSPTLAQGRLYLRNTKEIVCFDLKEAS